MHNNNNDAHGYGSIDCEKYLLKKPIVKLSDDETLLQQTSEEETDETKITYKERFKEYYCYIKSSFEHDRTRELYGTFIIIFVTLGLGSNIVATKVAQKNVSTIEFCALRFGVASLMFIPFTQYAFKEEEVLLAGLELGFWCALGYFFQALGLNSVDASSASFLSSFTIISLTLIAIAYGRPVSMKIWISIIFATLGLVIMEDSVSIENVLEFNSNDIVIIQRIRGKVLILISSFCFGIQLFRSDFLINSLKGLETWHHLGIVGIQLTICTIFFFICLMLKNIYLNKDNTEYVLTIINWARVPWYLVFFCGIVTTGGCIYSEIVAFKYIASEKAAILYSIEPLWGAIFSFLILGERMTLNGYIGGAIIFFSSFICIKNQIK